MKITLCGSARFEAEFHKVSKLLTLRGHTIYSLAVFPSIEGGKDWFNAEQKTILDLVHLNKIVNSDAILVVTDITGYVGDSTRREVAWACILGKTILHEWALDLEARVSFSGIDGIWASKLATPEHALVPAKTEEPVVTPPSQSNEEHQPGDDIPF